MGDLTATDALLAVAAATCRHEMHRARLALVSAGHGVLQDLDTSTLVAGTGTAGRSLLATTGTAHLDHTALRASRIHARLLRELEAAATSDGAS